MPTTALNICQYGKESTRGTAVAATKKLLIDNHKVPVDRKPEFVADALGVKARAARARVDTLLVEDTLVVPQAYFQCLPLFFNCGLKGAVTGTEQTVSQGDYLWTYAPSMTAANSPETITLELGDDVQGYEIEYVMFKGVKISADVPQTAGSGPVKISADYFGRQVTATTLTGSIAAPSLTSINAKLARLYTDSTWANRGTTENASILRGFEIDLGFGTHPKFFGSANRYFDSYGEGNIDALITLTLEGAAAVNTTLFADWQAGTAKAYSLKLNGPQIGTGTTNNLTVNVWGIIESIEPLGQSVNGNNLTKVLVHGTYDTTGATIAEVKVTANTSTI